MEVIPISASGGTASNIWLQHDRSGKFLSQSRFSHLNSKNEYVVTNAIIDILKSLMQGD